MFGLRCSPRNTVKWYNDIHSALSRGNREEVKKVVLSLSDSERHKLLHFAVRLNNANIARVLLKLGLKVKLGNMIQSETTLHLAVSNNNLAIVEMLLKNGSLIEVKDVCGETALHVAVNNGNEQITAILSNNNAHIDEPNARGMSALYIAAKKSNFQIAKILLENGANVNFQCTSTNGEFIFRETPLCIALEEECQDVVELLLCHGANANLGCVSPVFLATMSGCEKIVDLLLKHGSNVDTMDSNRSILYVAVEHEEVKIVQCILKYFPHLENKSNKMALNASIFSFGPKYEYIVELLTEYGLTVNKEVDFELQKRLLYVSIEKGYVKVVKDLVNHDTFMELSMFYNSSKKKNELISETLDPWHFCLTHFSPLHCAVRSKDVEIIAVLLERGFPINVRDEDERTPLHVAIEDVALEHIVRLLVEHGADVNMTFKIFMTPLLLATENGSLGIVKLLVKHGAHYSLDNNFTPMYITTENEHKQLSRLALDSKCRDYTTLYFGAEKSSTEIMHMLGNDQCSSPMDTEENEKSVKFFMYHSGEVLPYIRSILTPLYIAALKGYTEIVNFLLSHTHEATSKNSKEPMYLVLDDYYKVGRILLNEHGDKSKDHSKQLDTSSNEGYTIACNHLVERDANIVIQNKDGQTIPYLDVQGSLLVINHVLTYPRNMMKGVSDPKFCEDAVKSLLCGLNTNLKDTFLVNNFRQTLSNSPCSEKHNTIAELRVASLNSSKTVELLLKYGAKLNFRSDVDRQLLHFVAERGYVGIVEILLELGADINSRDKNGRTAFQIAYKYGQPDVVNFLLQYDSNISTEMGSDYPDENTILKSDYDDPWYRLRLSRDDVDIHELKWWVANLNGSTKNAKWTDPGFSGYANDIENCQEELEEMKSKKLRSDISFYDILTKSENYIARCVSIESIVEILKSNDYKRQFPLYASMIGSQLRKGMERIELFEKGKNTSLFKKAKLHCIEEVFFYLSNRDLLNFLLACQLPIVCPNKLIVDAAII